MTGMTSMKGMTRSIVTLTSAAVLAIALVTAPAIRAQGTTDFSGTWTLDAVRSDQGAGRGAGRGSGGNQLVITQDAAQMVVTQGNMVLRYRFDGSETILPPGGETKATAAWEKGRLVVSNKREYFAGPRDGYVTTTGRDVWALEGSTLTVERSVTDQRGRTTTARAVYTRS